MKVLEKVQKRAARFVTRNYTYEKGSMTDILKKLKWESLQKRRKLLTDDLIPKNRRCRNQHSLAFQKPSASTNAYLHSPPPPSRLLEIGMNSLILL